MSKKKRTGLYTDVATNLRCLWAYTYFRAKRNSGSKSDSLRRLKSTIRLVPSTRKKSTGSAPGSDLAESSPDTQTPVQPLADLQLPDSGAAASSGLQRAPPQTPSQEEAGFVIIIDSKLVILSAYFSDVALYGRWED